MNNPSAFPQPEASGDRNFRGMTLRDYFAAAALTGMWADSSAGAGPYYEIAKHAYAQADAMLKARER